MYDSRPNDGDAAAGAERLGRLEVVVAAFFVASWFLGLLSLLGLVSLGGELRLGLYPLFSLSAAIGWVMGNVYVQRSRRSPARRGLPRALWIYLLGPPGVLILVRSLAPMADQRAAPLVPVLAVAVFVIFFLVPVTLSVTGPSRASLNFGRRGESHPEPQSKIPEPESRESEQQ